MASKNPIKGYIKCTMPDCDQVGTVHAVGEHKIIETGEPPKNKRNIGRLYFNCPTCGCQQGKGEQFQAFIKDNMRESKSDLGEPSQSNQGLNVKVEAEVKPKQAAQIAETETPKPSESTQKAWVKPLIMASVSLVLISVVYYFKGSQNNGTTATASN
ncbi:hypothetical protein [Vibrio sp. qd031]|uniref:hypothetical protein n=1 Tax=Vibrio sp. qd031 TaxID=1603038 RepID=UPI00117CD885|nr:hypothetical protein [Vibrio sp. qd031]